MQIQRITRALHCANVMWPDLEEMDVSRGAIQQTQQKYASWYERVQRRGLKNEEALIRLQVRIRASQEPAYASTAQAGESVKDTK
jgi:hypothetical protein